MSFNSEGLWRIRHSVWALVKDPGASIAAVLTLIVGIAACVTVFSIADAALFCSLPYPKPDRLVIVHDQLTKLNLQDMPIATAHYEDYRNQPQLFEEAAGFSPVEFTLSRGSFSERVPGIRISAEMLPMLGIQPVAGRNVLPSEMREGQNRVVLLSHSAWVARFASRTDIVGQHIKLDGESHEVVGLLPEGFAFRSGNGPRPDLYAPIVVDPDPRPKPPRLRVLARLRPGVTPEAATVAMLALTERLLPKHQLYPGERGKAIGLKIAVTPLRERLFGAIRRPIYLLCGAVALVLLIACLNTANLLLVRALRRSREFAVRQALGASQVHVVTDVLTESLLLSAAAGAGAIALAYWCVRLLVYFGPPELAGITLDWRAVAFTVAVILAVACLSGLLPALRITRGDVASVLGGGRTSTEGPGRRRTLRTLIGVEAALALVLLTGSALLLRSFAALQSVNMGFDRDRLVTAVVNLPATKYRDPAQTASFYDRLLASLRSTPGVEAAAIASGLPLVLPPGGAPFVIEGRPFDMSAVGAHTCHSIAVDPAYFQLFGVSLTGGRLIDDRDGSGATRVAVVNETLAGTFFNGDSPIGKRVLIGGPRPNAPWLTVVGVVKDVRMSGPAHRPLPQIYTSAAQWPSPATFVVMRTAPGAQPPATILGRAIGSVDSDVPASDVRSMDERFAMSTSRPRFQTGVLLAFAAFALILALAGIGGVVAYIVTQKTKEIGVRMAIGASRIDVLGGIVREGMTPVLAGAAAGVIASMHLSDLVQSLLFETKPVDPVSFTSAAGLFVGVALIACLVAARRVVRIDPMTALRID